jgi:hypothetical protein
MEARFKIGDNVAVNFGYAGAFGACKITGIHFTINKVKYDVEVCLEYPDETLQRTIHKTRLYNIDSDFVVSRKEWSEWNQNRKSYGTEFFGERMPLEGMPEYPKNGSGRRVIFTEAFGLDNPPPVSEQDAPMSEDVLVDLNGHRKDFVIGWYDHDDKEWVYRAEDTSLLEFEHGQWMYLPLAKYDKN